MIITGVYHMHSLFVIGAASGIERLHERAAHAALQNDGGAYAQRELPVVRLDEPLEERRHGERAETLKRREKS